MTYIALIVSLLPGFACATALRLPEAQASGLKERPLLLASQQDGIAAAHEERRVLGQLLPQLNATHSSLFTKALSVDETAHTITLHGSQVIFNAATSLIQSKIAQLSTERSTHQYAARTNEVRQEIATAFLQTWLLQEKWHLIEALKKYMATLETKNDSQKSNGAINTIAWAATAATIAQHRAAIAAHPFAVDSAYQTLLQVMGTYPHAHIPAHQALTYDMHRPLPLLQEAHVYISLAYQYRPELKDKDAAQEQQSLIARSNRLSYVPTINASGSLSHSYAGAAGTRGTTSSLSVSLNWRFFDGMQAAHAAQAADATKLRTLFEEQELKNTIAVTIKRLCNTIQSTQALLAAAHAQVTAQKALLHQTQAAYAQGSVDRLTLDRTHYDYEAALHEMRTQRITLHSQWHTLALNCGYPPSGVFDEL